MPSPLPIASLNHLSFQTDNVARALAFYRDILGFKQVWRPPFNFNGAWLYNYGVMVHIIEGKGKAPRDEIQTRADHVAFHTEDIDRVEALLKEHGIEYRSTVVPLVNVKQVFFHDPDGNHIEVGKYLPVRDLNDPPPL